MIRFTMRIAGRVVAASVFFKSTLRYCGAFLCEDKPDFFVEISNSDIEFERNAVEYESALEGKSAGVIDDSLLECTALQRKIAENLFEYNTLLFHGSTVAVDGEAYLFTAKSGTGKSTHTRLWREMFGGHAVMVNDDKPFLKLTSEGIRVYGSPWKGKHGLGNNIDFPLKAICIIERGEENEICRISANDAISMLFQQSNRPQQPALMPKYMDLIEEIANRTAFYRLKCNMDPEAALISYQAMSGCVKEK